MSDPAFHMISDGPRPVAPFSHAVESDGWVTDGNKLVPPPRCMSPMCYELTTEEKASVALYQQRIFGHIKDVAPPGLKLDFLALVLLVWRDEVPMILGFPVQHNLLRLKGLMMEDSRLDGTALLKVSFAVTIRCGLTFLLR